MYSYRTPRAESAGRFGGERRGLNPQPSEPQTEGLKRRLSKIERLTDRSAGPDGCWSWTGCKDPDGYPLHGKKDRVVTRLLLAHKLGRELRDDEVARHSCDNPPCCNPAHLLAGSIDDNVRDREERDRTARGERVPHAKLTADTVLAILREAGQSPDRATCEAIGARHGVNRVVVLDIAKGRRWNSVTGLSNTRRVLPYRLRGHARHLQISAAHPRAAATPSQVRREPGELRGANHVALHPRRAGRANPVLFSNALTEVVEMFGAGFDAGLRGLSL